MGISQIYRDPTLYGHGLVSLPKKLWAYTKNEFSFPEHTSLQIASHCLKNQAPNKKTFSDFVEIFRRRILAPYASAASSVILLPIGLIAKTLHLYTRKITSLLPNKEDHVVCIHGFFGSPWNLYPLEKSLKKDGWDVVNWGYPSRHNFIAEHGKQLAKKLKELSSSKTRATHSFCNALSWRSRPACRA